MEKQKVEQFYDLRETTLNALGGVNAPAAKLLIDDFRKQVQRIGIQISATPLDGIAGTFKGNDDWSAVIQTTADRDNPQVHVSFDEHVGGIAV